MRGDLLFQRDAWRVAYNADEERLFETLGLSCDATNGTHEWTPLGRVDVETGSGVSTVDVAVCPMPARFWRFDVYTAENGKRTRLETGSGALGAYWPMARAVAEGMLTVEPLDEDG